MSPRKNQLPDGFMWGAATSATQAEGSQHNNWSVWETGVADRLATGAETRLKSAVPDWDAIKLEASSPNNYVSGDAADHYRRYEEDFDILKQLGLNAYRFSIEWSRIEPEPGKYDTTALDHYVKVVRALGARGIEPFITLHHFTDPVWLEGRGGWHGSEATDRFVNFAEVVAERLGEDVVHWCTVNEPGSYLLMRYLGGGAWPEWPIIEINPAHGYKYLKNVVKSHSLARAVIRKANPNAKVGMANALIDYQLGRGDPASRLFKRLLEYTPDTYLLERIKNDSDYIGVNYYMRMPVKSSWSWPQTWPLKWNGRDPQNDMGWGIYPEGIYNVTQKVKKYGLPIMILENGTPDAKDAWRAKFIRDHIDQLIRSRSDGADIRGYFYWSLLDNYEWSEGFWPKFGLISVDRKTQERNVRASAKTYSKIIKQFS